MREMKDSGIDWIGEIPDEWNISKLKLLGIYINGYAFKPEDWGITGKPIIRIQDLTDSSNKEPNYFDGEIDSKYYVKQGNILVSWAATLDAFIWDKSPGWLNQHIFKAIPFTDKINDRYFFWLLKVSMQNMNNDNKHGIFMQHVTLGLFNNYNVPYPSMEEQQKIANLLDEKVSEINNVIAKTKESIEEYKKLKQSMITQAVTKGLNPNVEMKDSGVEWIGLIPENWSICKVRHIGSTQNGLSIGADYFGSGYPFVAYGDVYKNFSIPKKVEGLVQSTEEQRENYSVKENDIFFTRTSETIEEVGFSAVCKQTIENATFAGFLIRLRPYDSKLDLNYAKYYFRSNHNRFYLVKEMNLVTRASLSQPLLRGMQVLLPPKNEQCEIGIYLDEKCDEIDDLINKKEDLIANMEAYKKSIIYEYITGKKEC